jgi:hypothetical protein
MGETVRRDLWLCQCLDEHCHGSSHSSLFTGLPNPIESKEQPPASVGAQGWPADGIQKSEPALDVQEAILEAGEGFEKVPKKRSWKEGRCTICVASMKT